MMNERPQEALVTKRSLGWAGAAAFLACAACCALPMLAVVGGGLASSLAALLSPGAEVIAGVVAASLTVAFFAVRARLRSKSCSTACAVDRSCCGGDSVDGRTP